MKQIFGFERNEMQISVVEKLISRDSADNKPHELIRTSVFRARFFELLCENTTTLLECGGLGGYPDRT
jgi:c-di-GMP-related signal transduction protein